jgi:Amt family ammonium transporter
VVLAVLFFDRIRVDDPVGALSVHLVNGVFGTICVGLFSEAAINKEVGDGLLFGGGAGLLLRQLQGVGIVAVFAFGASFAIWYLIKRVMGIRVSAEEEFRGLDIGEMGMEAYPSDPLGHGDYGLPPPAAAENPVRAKALQAQTVTGDAE